MKSFWRDNGLTIVLVAMFLVSAVGMVWSGHAAYNDELQDHGKAAIGLLAYLKSGDFLSALFENWESEFLQMSAYVMLTAMLFQRGSASRGIRTTQTALTTKFQQQCGSASRLFRGSIRIRSG